MRDGDVYLRTLGGLERVSVIFRRLDSDFADPLELRADSALGVPGLVDVIRAGNVVVANALGGGVVESPALDAYLPNVSRALVRRGAAGPRHPDRCGAEPSGAAPKAWRASGAASFANAFDAGAAVFARFVGAAWAAI